MYMLEKYLIAPSFNALFLTSIILLSVFYLLIVNFKQILNLTYYNKLILLCGVSLAVGIHGLLHLGLETNYGFNPYKWI